MDDGLLTAEQLHGITGKKRPHCQQAWFKREFGVDLPRNSGRVIISRTLFETLQARRAGVITTVTAAPERPKMHLLRQA